MYRWTLVTVVLALYYLIYDKDTNKPIPQTI